MNGCDLKAQKDRLFKLPNVPMDFDLYELWEGKKGGSDMFEQNRILYFNILMNKYKPALSVSTNSNFVYGEEVGYPRVFVKSSTDDPSKINLAEIIDNLKNGRLIVSNGPFIKFTVNGKGPGELVTDTDGDLDCELEVYAAPWIDTSYIDISKDGLFSKRIFQAPTDEILRYPRKGTDSKKEFQIQTNRDVILNITVGGRKSLDPVVAPLFYGEGGGIIAIAESGPIFIDYDGNGKYDPPTDPQKVGD
jgi:hypothetical protein